MALFDVTATAVNTYSTANKRIGRTDKETSGLGATGFTFACSQNPFVEGFKFGPGTGLIPAGNKSGYNSETGELPVHTFMWAG